MTLPTGDVHDLYYLLINVRRSMREHTASFQRHNQLLIDLRFEVKNLGSSIAGLDRDDTAELHRRVSRVERTIRQIEHDVTGLKSDVEEFKGRLDLFLSRLPER